MPSDSDARKSERVSPTEKQNAPYGTDKDAAEVKSRNSFVATAGCAV
jgi:hypothetical protein